VKYINKQRGKGKRGVVAKPYHRKRKKKERERGKFLQLHSACGGWPRCDNCKKEKGGGDRCLLCKEEVEKELTILTILTLLFTGLDQGAGIKAKEDGEE